MTLGKKKGLSRSDIKSDELMKEKEARLIEVMEDYKKRGVESSQIRQTTPLAWDRKKEVLNMMGKAERYIDYAEKMKPGEQAGHVIYNVRPLLVEIEHSLWKVSFIDQDLRRSLNRIRKAVRAAERSKLGI
jgi:hypothetical protein